MVAARQLQGTVFRPAPHIKVSGLQSRVSLLNVSSFGSHVKGPKRMKAIETDIGYDLQAVRTREFPWLARARVTYLNHAGTGPMPQRTVHSLRRWAALRARPWLVTDRETVFPALARVRALCASLVTAEPDEIALVGNTSFGINLAARSLPLSQGDVVLALDGEFPLNVYAWRAVEHARGIQLRLLSTGGASRPEDILIAALDDSRIRVVVVSWVSFATGYRLDLNRLGGACRERGIYLVVDATQGLGPAKLDAHGCGADIIACGGYKWLLSPWGAAFAFVRKELIQKLEPPIVGWFVGPASEDYTRLLDYNLRYFSDARRFEVMTLPVQDFVAMGQSIELLLETGPDAIEAYVSRLVSRLIDRCENGKNIRLLTPTAPALRAGIAAVAPKDPIGTSKRLREAGIVHSLREGAIRLSPYFYNTMAEMDRACDVLESA